MGCASSSPLVTANGGVLTAAKGAASDAVHAGEDALNDVKDVLNERVGQVKDAVVGAVQNVGHGIESAINGRKEKKEEIQDAGVLDKDKLQIPEVNPEEDFKIIPLKDPSERLMEAAMKEVEETVEKAKDYKDDAEKMADDLIKETEDVVSHSVEEAKDKVKSTAAKVFHSSPVHSIDSLKTDSIEPEIEKAMANDPSTDPPTPKPTLSELEELHSAASSVVSQVMADPMNQALLSTNPNQIPPNAARTEANLLDFITDEVNQIRIESPTFEDIDFEFNTGIIPAKATSWEELADAMLKPTPNKLQAYREATMEKSSHMDPHVGTLLDK